MARLALFLVLYGTVCGVWCLRSGHRYRSRVGQENYEIENKSLGERERAKRDAPNKENSNSHFIHSEKRPERIIWRDNSETRKQGQVPTVTKVLYHGIYPSLNVTVPVNSSNISKFRQKRAGLSDDFNQTNVIEQEDWQDERETTKRYDQEETVPTPLSRSSKTRKPGGNHYAKASHTGPFLEESDINGFDVDANDYYGHTHRSRYANEEYRGDQYRTRYFPSSREYEGDPENKGHVKLLSVGYYSVNHSTSDLRSYRNPPVRGTSGSNAGAQHRRARRSANSCWSWLDKILQSIRLTHETNNSAEPVKLEVDDEAQEVDEEAQEVYGYSSNGHSNDVDRIYLVPEPEPSSTDEPDEPILSDRLEEPNQGTVLLQAPMRRIACHPPKRYARGRCRTVW